ncbi:MAG: glycosyltransferase family 4 protein [Nitrospirota bacterium]
MVKLGHRVGLLTCSVEGLNSRYEYEGVKIVRHPIMDLNWLYRRGLKNLEGEVKDVFNSFIEELNPDVIHAHNMHYFSEVHAYTLERIARERGVPVVLTAHNTWDDQLGLELTTKVDWAHIIVVSYFIKKEIMGLGIDPLRVTVIHHGIDEERFSTEVKPANILKKYPQLSQRDIVFHPARIGLAKGCDTSIKALNLLRERHPDVILVMAGSKNIIDWGLTQQKDIAYLVNLIKHFGLEKNILIDSFTIDEMREIYVLSKVCIYPSSFNEPFGLTMLEAMATARPMIVTNSGGMPEIIRDGINGFVIPVRDFEMLAVKIDILLEDKRLRRHMGFEGKQMVESQYNKERVTTGILSVYRKVLEKRSRDILKVA